MTESPFSCLAGLLLVCMQLKQRSLQGQFYPPGCRLEKPPELIWLCSTLGYKQLHAMLNEGTSITPMNNMIIILQGTCIARVCVSCPHFRLRGDDPERSPLS